MVINTTSKFIYQNLNLQNLANTAQKSQRDQQMSQKIKYLYDNKQISDILAQGFAKICQQKPKFPINYLARYLKNHTIKKQQKCSLVDKLQLNQKILNQLSSQQQSIKESFERKLETQKVKQSEKDEFLQKISSAQRHEQILEHFCRWVNSRLNTAGVYIGELENQIKKINPLEEDGQDAHLQVEKQKVVKFKYASQAQVRVVVGKILSQDSVVGKLLNEAQVEPNQAEEENAQNQQASKSQKVHGEVYIPSVVGNQDLKFFTFPKLGAYFAAIMTVKCYLKEKLFDQNTVKFQTYTKVLHDFQKQMQEKQAKFKQMYDQKVNAGTEQKQLEDLEKQFEREKSQIKEPVLEEFSFYERKFVVCVDTLGLDRQISEQQKEQIRHYVAFFKDSWQNKQKQLLLADIQRQILHLKPHTQQGHDAQVPNFPEQYTTLLQDEEKQIPSHQQVEKVKDNEKLLQLESNTVRVQKTKQYLSQQKYLHYWDHLLQLNVIKYPQVIKQFLVLLGFKKDEFCFKGTNQLDWQKTKTLINANRTRLSESLAAVKVRGSKQQLFLPYAKCARIQKNLEGLQPLAIAGYNIYLSFVLRLLQLYSKTRVQDRQARVNKIQTERQNRQQKIREAEQKAAQKKEKLDTLKSQLQQKGQLQAFDQQAWKVQFDQQNPPIQIPDQIPNDIDRDLQDVPIQNNQANQPKPEQ